MKETYEYLNHHIKDGQTIGMGSGSTIDGYIPSLAEYIEKNNLNVDFVPTSVKTEKVLSEHRLATTTSPVKINFTIDGADKFTTDCSVVKGGGGSLLREKQIGYFSGSIIIIAVKHKMVSNFNNITIPVEINPFMSDMTAAHVKEMTGAALSYRLKDGNERFLTDNDNYIFDCKFENIEQLEKLQNRLLNIPGVIETGVFNQNIDKIVTFYNDSMTIYER